MAGAKLSGSGTRRTPRHTWTPDQKRCLLLLFERFHLEPEKIATTFNSVFRSEIDPKGFPTGLPYTSLRKQFQERKQPDNVSWSKITRPECPETESREREELSVRIKRILDPAVGETSRTVPEMSSVSPHFPTRSRKRKADVLGDETGRPMDRGVPAYTPSINQATTRSLHMVAIPQSEVIDRLSYMVIDDNEEDEEEEERPCTPVKQIRTGLLTPPSTMRVVRNSGPALEVSLKIHAEIEAGYSPPTEQEAHPPLGGLFYRFWDPSHSQGSNSAQGFVAKRYVRSNAVPVRAYAPPAKHLDPTDVWNHLNEESETTPFVSVSDSLTWSLSKVLKLVKSGEWKDAKLSIIDGKKLSPASIFHAAGFYRQLKKLRCFTNGAHRGVSSHEYLIWRDIPKAAMINTLNISDILAATANSTDLAKLLRFEVLSATGGYQTVIRRQLQQGNVAVTTSTATSMAKLAQLLGLQHNSAIEHHRHLTNDLVSSYKMVVSYHDPEDWRDIAAHYTHTLCRQSTTPVSAKDQALLKLAFLEGVRLGATYDFKLSRIDARAVQTVQRKAALIGLEDPGRIVSGEADAVKLHVGLEQKRQWKVFECRPSQMLLEDEVEVELDGESVFEMDEDGVVV